MPFPATWTSPVETGPAVIPASPGLDLCLGENRIVYKANSLVGLAEASAGGMGMALLPCYVGTGVPGLAQLSPPLPELEGELWMLSHPDLRSTARVRAFLDFCGAEIARRRNLIECPN